MTRYHLPACTALLLAATVSLAQEVRTNTHPAAIVAGNWTADARMSGPASGTHKDGFWWVGRMWGNVSNMGRVHMKADNGCTVEGVITSNSALGIEGSANMKGCMEDVMNRTYALNIRPNGTSTITLTLSRQIINATVLKYEVVGTFVRY